MSLTDTDRDAWAAYARHVRALPGRALPQASRTQTPARQAAPASRPAVSPRAPTLPHALITGLQPAGLDSASWARLRGGKLAPARTLDLHGKTVQAAFLTLERFLHHAHAERLRCVEVITGRGSGEEGGAIRRELPHWLNLPRLRPLVLAAVHPHPRNEGSVRLLLRRARPGPTGREP